MDDCAVRSSSSGGRLFAVGDIHGCIDELDLLLGAIELGGDDKIVFLGDYVDRGPSPRRVVDRLIELRDAGCCRTVFLRGNHEDMFLDFVGERGRHGDAFLYNGGRMTLASYGIPPALPREVVFENLPSLHLEFLRALELRHSDGTFLFVHAGVSPLRPLDAQSEEDQLWIREEFIRNPHPFRETIVFGHTPQREVLWHLPFKIGLDTGCVYGNKLSCLELTSGTLFQVERESRSVKRSDVSRMLERLKPPIRSV